MKDSHLKCSGCDLLFTLDSKEPIHSCPSKNSGLANHIIEKFLPRDFRFNIANLLDTVQIHEPYILFKKFFFTSYLAEKLNVNFDSIVISINEELRKFGEPGFYLTPLIVKDHIDGFSGKTLIKNETVNVSGSHKARHLMGNILYLEVLRKAKIISEKPNLSIYSCGNAALGAAAIAKAAGYNLRVFVPPNLNPNVTKKLNFYGAEIVECARQTGETGDPCYNRFKEALDLGSVPFSCSGQDNWSNIEGGQTLCLEIFAQASLIKHKINSIVIQVGGGALASSAVKTIEELYSSNAISSMPSIFAIQTQGGFPLFRAYALVLKSIADLNGIKCSLLTDCSESPKLHPQVFTDYLEKSLGEILAISAFAKHHYDSDKVQTVLNDVRQNMEKYMWPWETEPHSIAHGILDDITYDYFKIIQGLLKTGGIALTVSEEELISANKTAKSISGISVDPTGSSGFAGYLKLKRLKIISETSSTAVIFTGIER